MILLYCLFGGRLVGLVGWFGVFVAVACSFKKNEIHKARGELSAHQLQCQCDLIIKILLVKYILNLQRYYNKLTGLTKDLFKTLNCTQNTDVFLMVSPEGGSNRKCF